MKSRNDVASLLRYLQHERTKPDARPRMPPNRGYANMRQRGARLRFRKAAHAWLTRRT